MKERIRTTGNNNKQTKYEITLYNENVQNIFIYYINVLYIKASPPKCETTDWDGNIYIKIIYKLKHLQRQRVVKQYNFQSISTLDHIQYDVNSNFTYC